MRKFLSPIINIVSLILLGIAYGLAGITAAYDVSKTSIGSYYQIVWQNPVPLGIVGFFLMILGTVLVFGLFIPKARKCLGFTNFVVLVVGGIFALMTPELVQKAGGSTLPVYNQPGLIGMATLLFVVAFFSLIISLVELADKE